MYSSYTGHVYRTTRKDGAAMADERSVAMGPNDWLAQEQARLKQLMEDNGWEDDSKQVKLLEKAMWATFKSTFTTRSSGSGAKPKKIFPSKGVTYK